MRIPMDFRSTWCNRDTDAIAQIVAIDGDRVMVEFSDGATYSLAITDFNAEWYPILKRSL